MMVKHLAMLASMVVMGLSIESGVPIDWTIISGVMALWAIYFALTDSRGGKE